MTRPAFFAVIQTQRWFYDQQISRAFRPAALHAAYCGTV